MSRIAELIKEKCPNGVEYRKVWELTTWDKKYNSVDKYMQPKVIKYNYLLANQLNEIIDFDGDVLILETGISSNKKYTNEILAGKNLCEGEVIAIPWGGTPNVKYYNGKFVTGDNRIAISNDVNVLNTKFLYYLFENKMDEISEFYRGSGIKHPEMKKILSLSIPVPPLEVQEEIVRILDKFGQLEAELEAELEARKNQYEFWRGKLLNKNSNIVKISEITTNVYSGKCSSRNKNGEYPVYGSTGIIAQTNEYRYDIEKILIARVGANAGFVHIASGKYDVTDNTLIIDLKENVNIKYIYYYLQNYNLNKIAKGGGQPLITAGQIKDLEINIPPLKEQQRIVNILDKFDKLVNDISEGLPSEIELRKKQYEYYRNKLLSFKELINE